jgi:hypothetical protein
VDDLEVLSRFRADLPGPSAGTEQQSRARLLALAQHPGGGRRPRWRGWRAGWRRRVALGIGAAVLAASLAVSGSVLPFARHGPAPASAAAVLDAAARTAAAAPEVTLRPGQFYYEKGLTAWPFGIPPMHGNAAIVFLQTATYETWEASDGSGRNRSVLGRQVFFHPGDLARVRAAGIPLHKPGDVEVMSWRSFKRLGRDLDLLMGPATPRELGQLPAEPTALRHVLQNLLRKQLGPGRSGGLALDQQTFDVAARLLLLPGAPAALRAALFQVLKSLPGVALLGRVTDPAGRPGMGVAISKGATRSELIFDPATARALATITVDGVAGPGTPPKGSVTNYYAPLTRAVVNSDSARP